LLVASSVTTTVRRRCLRIQTSKSSNSMRRAVSTTCCRQSTAAGAGVPIAAGAAVAAQLDSSDAVAVAFFGDGATGEGPFHESLNISALLKLPVVWVGAERNRDVSCHLRSSKWEGSIGTHGPAAAPTGVG
jgi:TPP-dependent pyruvate/acetoin dehydrogenase alpha subunit